MGVGGATLRQEVLSSLRKQNEQIMRYKPISGIPLWPLYLFCLLDYWLEFLQCVSFMNMYYNLEINILLPKLHLVGHGVWHSNSNFNWDNQLDCFIKNHKFSLIEYFRYTGFFCFYKILLIISHSYMKTIISSSFWRLSFVGNTILACNFRLTNWQQPRIGS